MIRTLLSLALFCGAVNATTFWTLGDWGGHDVGKETNVAAVVKGLKSLKEKDGAPDFIINTGDSFYWCGLENVTDVQIQDDWVTPFVEGTGLGKSVMWYTVLGNHAYGYDDSVLVGMSKLYSNWILPQHYYTKRTEVAPNVYATWLFIDSSPCVSAYRSSSNSGYDPCGSLHPDCSGGPDPATCNFHPNIMRQNCQEQEAWIKKTLAAASKDDWLIVVSHHQAYIITEFDLVDAIVEAGMDLFLNGHAHTLRQYKVDNKGYYVTSGAGSMCYPSSVVAALGPDGELEQDDHSIEDEPILGHTDSDVFYKKVAGLTTHTFSSDGSNLTTTYLDDELNVLHTFTQTKGSQVTKSCTRQ